MAQPHDYEREIRPALLTNARKACVDQIPNQQVTRALLTLNKGGPIAAAVFVLLLDEVLDLRGRVADLERRLAHA
jgi:hypothetical protein